MGFQAQQELNERLRTKPTGGLRPASLFVLQMLAFHQNDKTGRCHPSTETLSKETGLSRRTVIRSIKQLETHHLVSPKKNGSAWLKVSRTEGGVNNYELPWSPFYKAQSKES